MNCTGTHSPLHPSYLMRSAAIELIGVVHDGGDAYFACIQFASGGQMFVACSLQTLSSFPAFREHLQNTIAISPRHPCMSERTPERMAAVWSYVVDRALDRGRVAA